MSSLLFLFMDRPRCEMNLHFSCPKCGYKLSAPEDCAGRSSKCRACGQPVTVPKLSRSSATPVPVQQPGRLAATEPPSGWFHCAKCRVLFLHCDESQRNPAFCPSCAKARDAAALAVPAQKARPLARTENVAWRTCLRCGALCDENLTQRVDDGVWCLSCCETSREPPSPKPKSRRPAPQIDRARFALGNNLVTVGTWILILGCAVTGYYLLIFDTTVAVYPELEQHGRRSPQNSVHNLGLMHQQTVWTIVGSAAIIVGLGLVIVGNVLCVTARRVDHD